MKKRGNQDYELWSERDGFFYDVLTYPNGRFAKFRVRSLVGIIPLYATETIEEDELSQFPDFKMSFNWFLENRKDLSEQCIIPLEKKGKKVYLLTLMNEDHLKSVLRYIWDPKEFRSPFGLRSLSKFHLENPFVFENRRIGYEPAESIERIKGGNSNWRGPIWIQTNFMLIDVFKKMAKVALGEIEIKIDEENPANLNHIAQFFADGIISIFKENKEHFRPVLGNSFRFKEDPHWKNYIPFYEYYNPETGQGLGASHQTGWSALVANLISEFRK